MVDPIIGKGLEGAAPAGAKPGALPAPAPEGVVPFKELLERSIQQVNAMQQASDQAKIDFASGGTVEAMAQMKKAELAFQQLVEIRNKLVDAYQEVMRMQI